jgi:hypothetical protein
LFRELYAGDKPAVRGRWPNVNPDKPADAVDKAALREEAVPVTFGKPNKVIYYDFTGRTPPPLGAGMELEILIEWAHTAVLVTAVHYPEDKPGKAYFEIDEYSQRNVFDRTWPRIVPEPGTGETGNSVPTDTIYGWLENSRAFVDAANEWYYDRESGDLYYKPEAGTDVNATEFAVPVSERLFTIKGTGKRDKTEGDVPTDRVKDVVIDNLTFEHSGWEYPSLYGFADQQSGQYQLGLPEHAGDWRKIEGAFGHPPAAIWLEWCENVKVVNNVIRNTAFTGIDMYRGAKNILVEGNLLVDVAGNGISAGIFSEYDPETGWYSGNTLYKSASYLPENTDEVAQKLTVKNNYVLRACRSYTTGFAVGGGYFKDAVIEHNTIHDIPTCGIEVGWGWSAVPTVMGNVIIRGNKLSLTTNSLIFDGGDLYTLGRRQIDDNGGQWCEIYENHVQSGGGMAGLYIDMGSSYVRAYNNVVEGAGLKGWIHENSMGSQVHDISVYSNYTTVGTVSYLQNGDGNYNISNGEYIRKTPAKDWPRAAYGIIERAGVEDAYKGLPNA